MCLKQLCDCLVACRQKAVAKKSAGELRRELVAAKRLVEDLEQELERVLVAERAADEHGLMRCEQASDQAEDLETKSKVRLHKAQCVRRL